ncbi:MAG TPA: 2-C-methyl-D-erythritol 4-phosphate cytidylyltransferase [Candidatus Kapabacteria bacterium]|nr:2-C-methyl-D-erythritol 4-phosphate cytidylyltransferase [Candidatus Kapabacteria bacterium]
MNVALIPAAGVGKRIGGEIPKQFLALHDKPILALTLEKFQASSAIQEIIVAAPEEFHANVREIAAKHSIAKLTQVVIGGEQRQHSVWNALKAAPKDAEIVIVHDAVRPLVSASDIQKVVDSAKKHGAAILAVRVKDTIKLSDEQEFVLNTLDREYLWSVQTPQAFKRDILFGAMQQAMEEHFTGTDEASVVENYGVDVKIIEGSYTNIKITTKEDLVFAGAILNAEKTKTS